ncbi:MAG: protoheme IX farnesyltransferase [Chloroflexi bacterium]|nr:protoheme IX farnesyltransferase [Chloroflexota bacterium]
MKAAIHIVSLLKLKTVALLVVVALVSGMVAGRGMPWDIAVLAILVAAGALACAGSGALNHYLDRDIDALQVRTSRRPLPAGHVRPELAALLGVSLIAISLALSWQINWVVTLFIGLGALTYVVVYTCWLKRRTTQNIVVGGLAGSWAALSGWFAVSHELSLVPILLALIVFLWTPVHFWSFSLAHLSDYRHAGLPMLPVMVGKQKTTRQIALYAMATLMASGLLAILSQWSFIYPLSWLALSSLFLASNILLLRKPNPERAWVNFKLSGIYLLGLFLAIGVDAVVG